MAALGHLRACACVCAVYAKKNLVFRERNGEVSRARKGVGKECVKVELEQVRGVSGVEGTGDMSGKAEVWEKREKWKGLSSRLVGEG